MADFVLKCAEQPPISLTFVEAKIKPETVGHVTPKYSAQTVYPAAGTVFGSVEVDPIPDPTEVKEIGSNGDHDVRRYGTARVDVQPKLQHREATPNRQTQNIEAEVGFDGLSGVTVNPIPPQYIVPEGSLDITQNANGIDVTNKASVNVNVPIPPEYIVPAGTKTVTENGTGINVREFERVDVDVSPIGERGFYFTDFDAGRPHTLVIQGYTDGNISFNNTFKTATNNPFNSVDTIKIKNCNGNCVFYNSNPTINRIEVYGDNSYHFGVNQASICANLTSVVCYCNITNISTDALRQTTTPTLQLLDFSHNTQICSLVALNAFSPAEGCIIRVPAALLSDWKNATNWNALTGVVWEGV